MPTQVNLGHVVGPTGPTGPTGPAPIKGTDYWTEEEQSAIVEEAAQEAAALVNGNVPKRTVSDLVAHGEDAYAQKPLEVRAKGKTVKNLWPVFNQTKNGVTVTTSENGDITLTGTPTAYTSIEVSIPFVPGRTYTALQSTAVTGAFVQFLSVISSGNKYNNNNNGSGGSNAGSFSFTVDAATTTLYAQIITPSISIGSSLNASFRVMLVDGTEALDCFTPPASITSVQAGNLVTSGKNLLDSSTFDKRPNETGFLGFSLPAGTYTLSCYNAEDWWTDNPNGSHWYIHFSDSARALAYVNMGSLSVGSRSHGTFTLPVSGEFRLYTYKVGISEMATDLQLELGSTATAYEPPNVTQTPLPEVELRSLPNGACDELVIKADGTCQVERNAVKVTFDGSEDEGWVKYMQNTSAFTAFCYNFFADSPINAGISQASAAAAVVCCELPVIPGGFDLTILGVSVSNIVPDRLYITAPSTVTDIDSFKQWLAANPITCVVNVNGKPDEPQSPVTLPALPAPTFNQYHDSPVPSDTSVEYARDINIVLSNLEAVQTALLGGE